MLIEVLRHRNSTHTRLARLLLKPHNCFTPPHMSSPYVSINMETSPHHRATITQPTSELAANQRASPWTCILQSSRTPRNRCSKESGHARRPDHPKETNPESRRNLRRLIPRVVAAKISMSRSCMAGPIRSDNKGPTRLIYAGDRDRGGAVHVTVGILRSKIADGSLLGCGWVS